MQKIDVVIPVYKSEGSLNSLIEALVEWEKKSSLSVNYIFVEDGGKDGSFEVLIELLKHTKLNYSTFRLAQNYGQYTATAVGFHYSTAEFVATIDDDLQHAPHLIDQLFHSLEDNNSDLVYGVYQKKKHSAFRNFASWMLKRIMHIDGVNYNETSSFRVMNSSVIKGFKRDITPVYFLEEMLIKNAGRIKSIEVEHGNRAEGKSSYSNFKLFQMALTMILFHSSIPLKLITRFGLLMSFVFFVIGVYFIYIKMVYNAPLGYTSIIVAIFFSTGLIMLSLGVIGEFIRKIWISQKRLDEVVVLTK
jgi:glycosyltransferase involved in cell wall biosynthesis